MCNLAGYSGKKKANIHIIKLLAIYGRERGTDGFGTWMGGKLWKDGGFGKEGDSYSVIYGINITPERSSSANSNTILIHNRAKSVGFTNKENAHPFHFNYIPDHEIVFAHNGTIKNIADLCDKYNIKYEQGLTDSYHLGKIIYENGFKVLEEYEGAAALSILDVSTDTLYLWKGFSQCESSVATEERPLHFYMKKDVLYYSSEDITLVTALNTRQNIYTFDCNTLYTIKEGVITSTTLFDRSKIVYKAPPPYSWQNVQQSAHGRNSVNAYEYPKTTLKPLYKIESSPQNTSKNRIYCWQGKYWKNGHILRGPYLIEDDDRCFQVTNKELEKYQNDPTLQDKFDKVRFFKDGYMMKSMDVYNAFENSKKKEAEISPFDFAQMLYPGTIYMKLSSARYSTYFSGHYTMLKAMTPLYSRFTYFNNNGTIEVTDRLSLDISPKNEVQILPESFPPASSLK